MFSYTRIWVDRLMVSAELLRGSGKIYEHSRMVLIHASVMRAGLQHSVGYSSHPDFDHFFWMRNLACQSIPEDAKQTTGGGKESWNQRLASHIRAVVFLVLCSFPVFSCFHNPLRIWLKNVENCDCQRFKLVFGVTKLIIVLILSCRWQNCSPTWLNC